MLKYRVLKTDSELLEFNKMYKLSFKGKETLGHNLPVASLKKRDKVVGVYKGTKMVAGYTIGNIPLTLHSHITKDNLKKMQELYPLDTCYDLSNIWKKGISGVKFMSSVWPRIVIDTIFFNLKRPNIIGYVVTGHGRTDAYNKAKPYYIQASDVKNEINIFVFTRINLIRAFLLLSAKVFSKPILNLLPTTNASQFNEAKK